jgi:hypothetical protein
VRDCVFLLADGTMEAMFRGFFGRSGCHHSLETRAFIFDPSEDIVSGTNDPRTYRQAHELLRPHQRTHRHAVIVLDNDWDGSPGVTAIRADIRQNMCGSGWDDESFEVVVIDPELENWIWQESRYIVEAFAYEGEATLREWLRSQDPPMWLDGEAKPRRPKEAVETVLRMTRMPRSAAIYRQIIEKVSVRRCTDPAFLLLCESLRRWFPAGGAI